MKVAVKRVSLVTTSIIVDIDKFDPQGEDSTKLITELEDCGDFEGFGDVVSDHTDYYIDVVDADKADIEVDPL